MIEERLQSLMMRALNGRYLNVQTLPPGHISLPPAQKLASGQIASTTDNYLLYMHIPFCEQLCPYCSFNRVPFKESLARDYFAALRSEMRMIARLGYKFSSVYIGGGTPTVLPDELGKTIEFAGELFDIKEVSCETNPNHLASPWLQVLDGRVQRLSVGVQSFNDSLLQQMQRFEKYGSGMQILSRLQELSGRFTSLNVDMIFNFPSQNPDMLLYDLAAVLESGCNQVTFYPLMASPAVAQSLALSVGRVSYRREQRYYETICAALAENFVPGSAWTFNAKTRDSNAVAPMIDEYIVNHEQYPAIGSGGFSYLDGSLYVNTFSVNDYIRRINEGKMSVVSRKRFSRHDQMRYRLMMQLFGLRLDKDQWQNDFGCSVLAGVPAEYAFFKAAGAFAYEDEHQIVLSPKGRYLLVACMRQFFIGVNSVRDEARRLLPTEERALLFSNKH
jgi:coproporphyrinogen III oxidase-like Fe-S oxidoreductase